MPQLSTVNATINELRFPGETWPLLRDVMVSSEGWHTVFFSGPTGCGKSTAMLTLGGVYPYLFPADVQGHIEFSFHGREVVVKETNLNTIRESIGFIHANPDFSLFGMTARDEISFRLQSVAFNVKQLDLLAQLKPFLLGTHFPMDRPISSLSQGQRQRLALLGQMISQKACLALDEPTAMLDPEARAALPAFLESLFVANPDLLLIIATHDHKAFRGMPGCWVKLPPSVHSDWAVDFDGLVEAWPSKVPPNPPSLRCLGLSKCFDRDPHSGLKPFTEEFRPGCVHIVQGPNGAGKTTLGFLCGGVLKPGAGSAKLGERSVWKIRPREPGRLVVVLQNPSHQFLTMSLEEEVSLTARGSQLSDSTEYDAIGILQEYWPGFNRQMSRDPRSLSWGEQKLFTMLMVGSIPQVLVVDEPEIGLDELLLPRVIKMIRKIADRGAIVIVITHTDPDLWGAGRCVIRL
jgi:energy-coupling factor transporter ATP-binding protein EcfA2